MGKTSNGSSLWRATGRVLASNPFRAVLKKSAGSRTPTLRSIRKVKTTPAAAVRRRRSKLMASFQGGSPLSSSTPIFRGRQKARATGSTPGPKTRKSPRHGRRSTPNKFVSARPPPSPRTILSNNKRGLMDPPILIDETLPSFVTVDRTGELIDLTVDDDDDEVQVIEMQVVGVKKGAEVSRQAGPDKSAARGDTEAATGIREAKPCTAFPAMGTRASSRGKLPSSFASQKDESTFNNVMVGSSGIRRRRGDPRPIVVDGQNVAVQHSISRGLGARFSSRGIDLCVRYFQRKGHEVTVFVPQFRTKSGQADDRHLLEKLMREGVLSFTPSRTINGVHINSYDDRYVIQFAVLREGVVVSNDNYEDLRQEDPRYRDVIVNRLLKFTWARDDLLFPSDPMGRHGPSLDRFLRF